MSTDLYQVRVLTVEGSRLTCQVTAFDPRSEGDPPPSQTLALQFLWEPWMWFSEGLLGSMANLAVSPEQAELLGRSAPIGRELAGKDLCDGDWTRRNVGRFIQQVEVRDRRWFQGDHWGDVGAGPPSVDVPCNVVVGLPEAQGTFIITTTDPRWLEHLRQGMEWGSTAY